MKSSLPPSLLPAAPTLETRQRVHAWQVFLAAMDPALKEYLDQMPRDAKSDSLSVLKQLQAQSSQINDQLCWKPDLEARFAKLETMVATAPSSVKWSDTHPPAASQREI
ncbi:hypothetical protein ZWY2020_043325 [Hordeum vulgare]|nr:hypothetical protein ZWY2020_043325 [Hordeum vulgare]